MLHADYQKNQPTRKLTQAAGKDEGDANVFPSMAAANTVNGKYTMAPRPKCFVFADKEAGKKMSEAKDK